MIIGRPNTIYVCGFVLDAPGSLANMPWGPCTATWNEEKKSYVLKNGRMVDGELSHSQFSSTTWHKYYRGGEPEDIDLSLTFDRTDVSFYFLFETLNEANVFLMGVRLAESAEKLRAVERLERLVCHFSRN